MMTGTVIGYKQHRQHHVAAARADQHRGEQRPHRGEAERAGRQQPDHQQRVVEQRRLEHQRHQRHDQDLDRRRAGSGCRAACRRRAPADRSARSAARAASRPAARARRRGRAPACPRTRWRSTGCRRPTSCTGRPSLTNPNANTSTQASAKNTVVSRISRVRVSIRRSLRVTIQTARANALMPASLPSTSDTDASVSPSIAATSCVVRMTMAPALRADPQPLAQRFARRLVEPGERLVEQQQARLVDQRPLEREPLAHAAREARRRRRRAARRARRARARRRRARSTPSSAVDLGEERAGSPPR